MGSSNTTTLPWLLPISRPDWVPKVSEGTRILVVGASGGIGNAVVKMLLEGPDCIIGAHSRSKLCDFNDTRVIPLVKCFNDADDCLSLVSSFINSVGGIDALVVLSGAIHYPDHWININKSSWNKEIETNLNHPFFLARAAIQYMQKQSTGGRVLLTGTESALHGGSPSSFPYAVSKRATECMVQGMAREGAPHNILVNGIRFGYIESGFHQRWHGRTAKQMKERASLVPLKRGGHVDEAASLIIFLLSNWASFLTGQMIPLTGGDWL